MSTDMKIINNNGFSGRVKKARVNRGITQTDLAKLIGVSRVMVANYESGKSEPKDSVMNALSAALGVSIKWLETGDKSSESHIVSGDVDFIRRPIPLISSVQAALYPAISGEAVQWIFPPEDCAEGAFALTVTGDSMEPDFSEGSIIIVEPNIDPLSGDFVVAKLSNSPETTFKRLINDGNKSYLAPVNTRYPLYQIDELTFIIGVVTHSIRRVYQR